jgi:hypothetical protein
MPLPRFTIDQIQAIEDRPERVVDVPDWGCSVVVRGMTAQQINQCSKRAEDPRRGGEINTDMRNGWYLVEGLLEPRIDIKVAENWLTERSFGPVSTVLGAILEESGLTGFAKERAKSALPEEPAPSV